MHDPPPSVYENWPAPNFVDPETRGVALTVINSSVGALSIMVVLARVYTRTRITGSFGLDDVFICLALIPSLGLTGCTLASERVFGWNRHIWDATAAQIHGGLILEFFSGILYIVASLLTKLSVVFFCRRLVTDYHPAWYRRGLDVFAVLTFVGCAAYIITFCLSCEPLNAYWSFLPPTWTPPFEYHCISVGAVWMSGSILNGSWDLLTWLVPLPIVLQLELPTRQRIAVMALFATGLVVVAAGVMKTIYVHIAFEESYDVTWTGYPLWICGALEIDIGILCASAPALRPLFSHIFPKPDGRRLWVRRSYARMSKGRDTPGDEEATPLSPLSPAVLKLDTQMKQDQMKPWRGRSARSSINKFDMSPVSPANSTGVPSAPASRRLTPLNEIVSESGADPQLKRNLALLPPEDDAIQRHLEDPEKSSVLTSPAREFYTAEAFSSKATAKLPPVDTTSVKARSIRDPESPVSRRGHSRKASASASFDAFNFNMPATSSRRTSQSTVPRDYLPQASPLIAETSNQQQPEMSEHNIDQSRRSAVLRN